MPTVCIKLLLSFVLFLSACVCAFPSHIFMYVGINGRLLISVETEGHVILYLRIYTDIYRKKEDEFPLIGLLRKSSYTIE